METSLNGAPVDRFSLFWGDATKCDFRIGTISFVGGLELKNFERFFKYL